MLEIKTLLNGHPRLYGLAQRAYHLGRYARGTPHERDYEALRDLPGDGLFVDVGANSGTSALSYRIYRKGPILSLEPGCAHAGDLWFISHLVGDMEVMHCAAGRTPGVLTLHIPYFEGRSLSHLASLDPGQASFSSYPVRQYLGARASHGRFEMRTQRTPVVRLDDLELSPAFVKIDVQGCERGVLDGLDQTLRRHRPVLLIETGSDRELLDHLAGLGYRPHYYDGTLRPLMGRQSPSQNLFFLPTNP